MLVLVLAADPMEMLLHRATSKAITAPHRLPRRNAHSIRCPRSLFLDPRSSTLEIYGQQTAPILALKGQVPVDQHRLTVDNSMN